MNKSIEAIKTTIVGGIIFLVPLVVVTAVMGKALQYMVLVAKPLERWIPIKSLAGVAIINILAFVIVLMICFLAGWLARSAYAKRLGESVNSLLMNVIPGYAFFKGITDTVSSKTEDAKKLSPVLVRFDDNAQLGFEVERIPEKLVVVYLPSAPNPWSGTIVYVSEDRVDSIGLSVAQAIKNIHQLGRGSGNMQEDKAAPIP
jgi:uncharacterized membrane protein